MNFFNIFKKKILANCGHKTFEKATITAFGSSCKTKIPIINNKTDYCHRCLEKMAIRCAWCGKTIFIGDPITLYSLKDKSYKMPGYAVFYDKEYNSYIGCLRWDCAQTGADRAGFWYPPGRVIRVPSILEMAMQKSKMACINNLNDVEEAVKYL